MRSVPLLVRFNGVDVDVQGQKMTPRKFDNVPTDELSIEDPSQFIIIKKRFKLVVTTALQSFKVMINL